MQISNFTMDVLRIRAYNYRDAKEIAKQYGFDECKNATRQWIKAGKPTNPNKIKEFQVEMMTGWFKNWIKPGRGLIISLQPGVRLRRVQWKLTHFVPGWQKLKFMYEIRLEADGALIGQAPYKRQAMNLAKKLMRKYREPIIGYAVLKNPQLGYKTFKLEHAQTEKGRYIVFGPKKNFKRYEEVRTDF